jgi:glycine dehydrogenase
MPTRLRHPDEFHRRHIGPDDAETSEMLRALGAGSLDELVNQTVPASIRLQGPLKLPEARTEHEMLADLELLANKNEVARSFLGMGYHDCFVPPVILRNILLNPGWYTQYTPYQAEISQGRLEALLNFQTMITDLTGFEVANASLLDEATAAAEAMTMLWSVQGRPDAAFFVSEGCHPQNIEVVRTRARPLGIRVLVGDAGKLDF